MAISSITSTPVAFRSPPPPAATLNTATQPSNTPQQTGRTHQHGGSRGVNLLSASNVQSSSSNAKGSLLDTLI